jgi:hypothetical protein
MYTDKLRVRALKIGWTSLFFYEATLSKKLLLIACAEPDPTLHYVIRPPSQVAVPAQFGVR